MRVIPDRSGAKSAWQVRQPRAVGGPRTARHGVGPFHVIRGRLPGRGEAAAAEPQGAWLTAVFAVGVPALMLGLPFSFLTPVLIIGLAALTLAMPSEVLFGVMFGVGFLIGPIKIAYGGWSAYIIPDAIAALVLLRWAVDRQSSGKPLFGGLPISTAFCALLVFLLLEIGNPNAPLIRSVFGLRSWLMFTMMLFVGYASYRGPRQVERLYRILIGLSVGTAVYGYYQWQAGPTALAELGGAYERYARDLGPSPWEVEISAAAQGDPIFRAVSTFVSPNMFGINLCFVILIGLGPLVSRATSLVWRIAYALAIVVMGSVIPVTGSRAPVVYLLGSLVIVLLLFRKYRILSFATPLAIVGVIGAQALTQGLLAGRYALMLDPNVYFWKWFIPIRNGFSGWLAEPIGEGLGFTAGPPNFIDDPLVRGFRIGTVDSGYGAVVTELGLAGLAIFVWFVVSLARAGYRAWRDMPPGHERDLFLAPVIWAVALPVWTLLSAPHASIPGSTYTWLFMGMLLRAGDLARLRAGVVPGRLPVRVRPLRGRQKPVIQPEAT